MSYSQLIEGLPVSFYNELNRLTLSSGTLFFEYPYEHKSTSVTFVPQTPWRNLSVDEQHLFCNSLAQDAYEMISIVKLDTSLIKSLSKLKFPSSITNNNLKIFHKSRAWQTCRKKLIEFALHYSNSNNEQIEGGIYFGEGNLENSTINQSNNEIVGLHLDGWETAKHLKDRCSSKNRICFNLGSYPRYLCFLNLGLNQIYDLWTCGNASMPFEAIEWNDYSFIYKFLKQNPNYPITRLRINTGEAYIAPTESILHDGSSSGNPGFDITYTLRSFYRNYSI